MELTKINLKMALYIYWFSSHQNLTISFGNIVIFLYWVLHLAKNVKES